MNNFEISELSSEIFRSSRARTKYSQDHMAKALGVSKRTIMAWEQGTSSPNLSKFIQWFDVLGVPIYPYLYMIAHQDMNAKTFDEKISDITNDMSDDRKSKIIYELYGEHGSDPVGLTEMITAYLHLPLKQRVLIAKSIATSYMVSESLGELIRTDDPLPDMELLKAHLIACMDAVIEGKASYIYEQSDKNRNDI